MGFYCAGPLIIGELYPGKVFVGGFSVVPESAKRWVATMKFNSRLCHEFENFYIRPDTFSQWLPVVQAFMICTNLSCRKYNAALATVYKLDTHYLKEHSYRVSY